MKIGLSVITEGIGTGDSVMGGSGIGTGGRGMVLVIGLGEVIGIGDSVIIGGSGIG